MSRIGQQLVTVPAGVTVVFEQGLLTVTGPKGVMTQPVDGAVTLDLNGETIKVRPLRNDRVARAFHGLYRQLLHNMIVGVTQGFSKTLEMKGTGYRAEVQGNDLVLSVGFSHPVRITAPEGIEFKVEKNVNITVSGIDRQKVGQTSAEIRAVRKPEPYKGKGIKYAGEIIRRKAGKAAKAAA